MPFTDAQLGAQIRDELVNSGVMTAAEQGGLLGNPTEINVRATLTQNQLANFDAYWAALGAWMTNQGGNIAATSGLNVPGREVNGVPAPVPAGLAAKVLYNDAFRDVTQNLGPGFLPVKAVSNELRFGANM